MIHRKTRKLQIHWLFKIPKHFKAMQFLEILEKIQRNHREKLISTDFNAKATYIHILESLLPVMIH